MAEHGGSEAHTRRPIAAAGLVCFREDDVLVIRRGRPPREGEWSLPGGRIECGERAGDAALRELTEETGCAAAIIGLVDVIDTIMDGRHYILIDYAARWLSGEPQPGDDAREARFFSPAELAEIDLWSETRRVIEAARAML